VERAARIVEADGGYLELARALDGRSLWVARWWDWGYTDVDHFEVHDPANTLRPGVVLQFVDGIFDTRDPEVVRKFLPEHRIYKSGDGVFELLPEAWLVESEAQTATRPKDGSVYPLLPASGRYSQRAARRLQWLAFARNCPEVRGPCVYYGQPVSVCGHYFDASIRPGAHLLIEPTRCNRAPFRRAQP
jgi:hypothetical protein